MSDTRKLWTILSLLLISSFSVLLWMGSEIYRQAPPVPAAFQSDSGEVLYTKDDIQTGREVWQSIGGMQLGSIWGHGAYVAPDWSADWLHREALALLDIWAQREFGRSYAELAVGQKAGLEARLREEIRANTYDADANTVTLSPDRIAAARTVAQHYYGLFGSDPAFAGAARKLCDAEGTIPTMSAAPSSAPSSTGPPGPR
jgi:nitric oxide reductase subunit B